MSEEQDNKVPERRKAVQDKGWNIVHEQDSYVREDGDGVKKEFPAVYRAEKTVNDKLVNQISHSLEGLYDAILDYEEHLKARGITDEPVEVSPDQQAARDNEAKKVTEYQPRATQDEYDRSLEAGEQTEPPKVNVPLGEEQPADAGEQRDPGDESDKS